MLNRIRRIIAEFEIVVFNAEFIGEELDNEHKYKILTPFKDCIELLKQVEKKLVDYSNWAEEELHRLEQLD